MAEKMKVVHYINQFYGGLGGEDTASMGFEFREEAVGPGLALQGALGEDYEIVATIICGDNFIAENTEEACKTIIETTKKYDADLFIAGPGFNAGRYGIGCGASTTAVTEELEIPAVTGLYEENPGTDLYKNRCYVIATADRATKMRQAIKQIAEFSKKLINKEEIGNGEVEGYLGNGPAIKIDYTLPACKRGLDMLLNKYRKEQYKTEVLMLPRESIELSVLEKPLSEAKIAFVTDGGIVPKGNPEGMVPTNSKRYAQYSFDGAESLLPENFEISHQGYDNSFVLQDPNRLVPVDAAKALRAEGKVGEILDFVYTTAGVMTPMDVGAKFGQGIAEELKEQDVDAVVLTST